MHLYNRYIQLKTLLSCCCLLLIATSCRDSPASQQPYPVAIPPVDSPGKQKPAPVKSTLSALDSLEQANAAAMATDEESIQKAWISKADSSIGLIANMRLDHRIFGYAQPDVHARKMLLLSIFTNDVQGNPFQLPYGAYYEISGMNAVQLKYAGEEGSFIKADVSLDGQPKGPVYIEKRWVTFDD